MLFFGKLTKGRIVLYYLCGFKAPTISSCLQKEGSKLPQGGYRRLYSSFKSGCLEDLKSKGIRSNFVAKFQIVLLALCAFASHFCLNIFCYFFCICYRRNEYKMTFRENKTGTNLFCLLPYIFMCMKFIYY